MIELKKKEKKEDPEEPLFLEVCEKCGSDNVEERIWVNVNTKEISGTCEDDEGYCNDCQLHVKIIPEDQFVEDDED